jgi:adenylate cyclase
MMDQPASGTPAALLREREAQSLTLMVAIALVGFVALVAYVLSLSRVVGSYRESIGALWVTLYFVVNIVLCTILLVLLRRRKWVAGVGILVALSSATFPAVATLVVGSGMADDAPASLLTKLPVAAVGLATIAMMALTLRPLYVVIVGVGVGITLVAFFAFAALDPTTVRPTHSIDPYIGPAISLNRLIFELVFVAVATAGCALAARTARRTVREAAQLQRATDQLSRYFSPEVAAGIRDGGEAFVRGGREQDVVVLFSDLVGYTRLCSGLSPSEALELLSEYQEHMVPEIFKAGGTLDKFIGDGIMATFGTPSPVADAADRAVQAARGMMSALERLNALRASRGEPPLAQRIGIHAGPAIVGNVGTRQRLEFSVIGDAVNVANRIEAAGKKTGKPVMMSAAVLSRLSDATDIERVGEVALDGQPKPIELYALR